MANLAHKEGITSMSYYVYHIIVYCTILFVNFVLNIRSDPEYVQK